MFGLQLPFDLTKPPPPIDDSFPHPALLEQLRQSDAALVQQFLLTRTQKAPPPPSGKASTPKASVDISTYRSELREALLALEALKHSKTVLEELRNTQEAEGGDSRWREELDRTEQLESTLHAQLAALEDGERVASLTRNVALRKKKRTWQRRRKVRLAKAAEEQREDRERRTEEMVRWETEWKERLEKERAAREELQAKTLILADVRRRKARAKRYLGRFEKSIKLHQQRQTSAEKLVPTGGGERAREATGERFRKDIDALIAEWKSKLTECIKEERQLKDDLARRSAENESRRRQNRWRKVLFGDPAAQVSGRRTKAAGYDDIIATRWAWDAYAVSAGQMDDSPQCSTSGEASAVPTGWVLPPENPAPDWAPFRTAETKGKSRKKNAAPDVCT